MPINAQFPLPKKLKIGAHHYIISRDNSNLPDGETAGYHEPAKSRITVANNMPATQELVTFIHEIIHAINGEVSEVIADSIAQGLAQVLIDNKFIKLPDARIRSRKEHQSPVGGRDSDQRNT